MPLFYPYRILIETYPVENHFETPSTFILWTCSVLPPRITLSQRLWLKISDQPVKEETLLVIILLIHRNNPSILALTINYMSPNFFWTSIKFTVSSSTPNCYGPSSSHLEYSKNRLLCLAPSDAYVWADRSVSSLLDEGHWSACQIIQMQYLQLFFSAGPIVYKVTTETHPLEHGLMGVTTTRRLATFS